MTVPDGSSFSGERVEGAEEEAVLRDDTCPIASGKPASGDALVALRTSSCRDEAVERTVVVRCIT